MIERVEHRSGGARVPFRSSSRRRSAFSQGRAFVIGNGLAGLIAAHSLRENGANVTIVETRQAEDDFFFASRRIYSTPEMVDLLQRFELPFSEFIVRGGIMLRGFVWPYPLCFKGLSESQTERLHYDHFAKTIQSSPGQWAAGAMDEAGTKPRRAIRCDIDTLANVLGRGVRRVKGTLQRIEEKVIVVGGYRYGYDFLIVTLPLWEIFDRAFWYVPEAVALRLNVAFVVPRKDPFAKWDFVFTPYTPANSIFRVWPIGNGYACEFNGLINVDKLISDLNFIFPDGFAFAGLKQGLNGHLFPLSERLEWPANVAPVGRVAEWQQMTVDRVLKSSTKIAKKWFGNEA